jgi:SanA protein
MAAPVGILATLGASVLAANAYVQWTTRRYVFYHLDAVPKLELAIVLGCAPRLRDGRPNYYFEARLDAATELYLAGKVRQLLVSGGPMHSVASGAVSGSECDAMREGLLARGVPEAHVTLDVGGHRTLRSVERARTKFGLSELVFVTQGFHAPRAVFLARQIGMQAFAYTAASPPLSSRKHLKLLVRESLSRTRAVFESSTTKNDVPGR